MEGEARGAGPHLNIGGQGVGSGLGEAWDKGTSKELMKGSQQAATQSMGLEWRYK